MTHPDLSAVTRSVARLVSLALLVSSPAVAQQSAPVPSQAGTNPGTNPGANATAAAPARPPRPADVVTGTGPNGATMRCRDGSYPAATAPDDACESKGGVLVRFPLRRVPASAPRLARVPAPVAPSAAVATQAVAPQAGALSAGSDGAPALGPAPRPPSGATLLCGDGSFVVADTSRARCAGRGGVSVIYPVKRRP